MLHFLEVITGLSEISVYRAFNISSGYEAGFNATISKLFSADLRGGVDFETKSLDHLSAKYLVKKVLLGASLSKNDTKLNYMKGIWYMQQTIYMEEYDKIYSEVSDLMNLTLPKIAESYQTLLNNEFVEKYNITNAESMLFNKRPLRELKLVGFNVEKMTFTELVHVGVKYGECFFQLCRKSYSYVCFISFCFEHT